VADDANNQELPQDGSPVQPPAESEQPPAELELPDRLRVHSLARVLGTTSKRVLDAAVLAYQSGALDLASVLDARRSHQRQTDEWLRSKADALRAYVVLARALG